MKAMRFAARALVVVFLVVSCCEAMAAEPSSSWWPFGHHDAPTVAQPPGVAATSSPFANVPNSNSGPVAHEVQLPQSVDSAAAAKSKSSWLHMPRLPKVGKSEHKSKPTASPNAWASKTPSKPTPTSSFSPLQSVKNGAHKVSTGTKTAWHKTIDALSPADKAKKPSAPQMAQREVKPPFWKRMLGSKEPELKQPQTVPQWMAQKRLDP
jgi:hypothetical protein